MTQQDKRILSDPIYYTKPTQDELLAAYFDNLYNCFIKKDVKPSLKGCSIYYNLNKKNDSITYKFPPIFLHSISFSNKDTDYEEKSSFDILPCNNDQALLLCQNNCKMSDNDLPDFAFLDRYFCYYRLSRVHWIKDVIAYANKDNSNIKIWTKEKKNQKGKKFTTYFVRYCDKLDDFVVIFIKRNNMLYFQTAYPVILRRAKRSFDKDYEKYINKKTGEP